MDRRCNKPDKTGLSAGICGESRCHSPCCMAMQSGEICGMVYCLFYRIDPAIALRASEAVRPRDVMVNLVCVAYFFRWLYLCEKVQGNDYAQSA